MTNDIWPPTTRCLAGKDPIVCRGTSPHARQVAAHGRATIDNPAAAFYEHPPC